MDLNQLFWCANGLFKNGNQVFSKTLAIPLNYLQRSDPETPRNTETQLANHAFAILLVVQLPPQMRLGECHLRPHLRLQHHVFLVALYYQF